MLPIKRSNKRSSRELRCVLFDNNVPPEPRRESPDPPALSSASSARSWQRCGESFVNTPLMKTSGSRRSSAGRTLAQCVSAVSASSSDGAVNITWSSSDAEESDSATSSLSRKRLRPPPRGKDRETEEDIPLIDSDSEGEEFSADAVRDDDDDIGGHISECESESEPEVDNTASQRSEDVEISGYGSDGDDHDGVSLTSGRTGIPPAEGSRPSVSSWMRSVQAMLQTPQKQLHGQITTPEDSAKKRRRKFQSGGLAERLSRLHSRQRSAISFWRHQSDSSCSASSAVSAAGCPGLLLLGVLEVHQECSLLVARCERRRLQPSPDPPTPEEGVHFWVLFSKQTTTQLLPAPGDVLKIHPPWESLCVQAFSSPIILNTHFSQKVCASSDLEPVEQRSARRYPPHALCNTFGSLLTSGNPSKKDHLQQASSSCGRLGGVFPRHCVSLLEAIEGLGQAGSVDHDVEVVVQRVYSVSVEPVDGRSAASVLRSKARPGSMTAQPPKDTSGTRLCALVQDDFGTFSVVHLHLLPEGEELQRYHCWWQGRSCRLRSVKVLQRLTRERNSRLFSLIDSLWPPLVGSPTPSCLAPSFCYLLSGQQSSVQPLEQQDTSPLYRPPPQHHLRHILQRTEGGRADVWLVLTDSSLQEEDQADAPTRRTLPLCVTASCAMASSVLAALRSTAVHRVAVRDAFMEHGLLLCAEQSLVELCTSDSAPSVLPSPLKLDPVGPQATPCSLCTATGVVVGVDESTAFSWSACSHCGSEDLKTSTETPQTFHCVSCGSSMDKPQVKVQLEVFLRCPTLTDATVKVKLQQTTIGSLLGDPSLQSTELSELDVDSVLGKELGPLPVFVRALSRTPSLWIGLDEVASL